MKLGSFFKAFPVPKYLHFPAVGFDISDDSVRFMELLDSGGKVTVGRYDEVDYSSGDVVKTLYGIRKKHCFNLVNVSVPEEESYLVRMHLPYIRLSEIREAVELHLEEYIPYSGDEVEFSYEILKVVPGPEGHIDLNVGALPKQIVAKYLDIFKEAGLEPAALVIEAEATGRSLVPKQVDGDTVMVVNMGKKGTVLSIISRGSVWFNYTFGLGGDFLNERLQKTFKISREEAEKIKFGKGLLTNNANQEVFECLMPALSSIRDEIDRHRHYWMDHQEELLPQLSDRTISRVILCGSQSAMPGITDYLSIALSTRAMLGNPWINIFDLNEYVPPITHKDSLKYATAIGLAEYSLKLE